MQRRTGTAARPALAVFALAASALVSVSDAAPAETCLKAPKGVAPQGSHWYYRIDRATQHRCWYLAEKGRRVAQRGETRSAPPQAEADDDEAAAPAPAAPAPVATAPAAAVPPANVAQSVPEPPSPKITTLVTRNANSADQSAQVPAAAESTQPATAPSAAPSTMTSEAPPLAPEPALSNRQPAAAIAQQPAPQPAPAALEETPSPEPRTTPTLLWALGGIALLGFLASAAFLVMALRRRRTDVLNMRREAEMLPLEHAPEMAAEDRPTFEPQRALDPVRQRDLEPIRQHDDVDEILQRLARRRRAA